MSTFIWLPSYNGTSSDTTPKVRMAQFGEGYSQRVGDGINNIRRSWSVSFEQPKVVMDQILAFLKARAGVELFVWVPPTGVTGKWLCASWKETPVGANDYTISATFTEEFG